MTLSESFFVSEKLHEKSITLPDGSTHILHFRELPAPFFVKFRDQQTSAVDEVRAAATSNLIAASLCEPDGKPALTAEKALTLTAGATKALMQAVMEVNEFTGKKPSPSAEESGSSTN